MTILFVGSSVTDFDTTPSGFKCNDSTADLPSYRSILLEDTSSPVFKTLDSVTTGTVWFSFYRTEELSDSLGGDWSLSSSLDRSHIIFYDGENNPMLYFGFNANTGSDETSMQGRVYLTDGTTADLTDIVITGLIRNTGNIPDKFDIKITPGSGFSIYHNRVLMYTYTGSVGNSASTVNGIGKFGVGMPDAYSTGYFAHILLATIDTRFLKVDPVVLSTTPSVDTSSDSGTTAISAFMNNYTVTLYDSEAYNAFDAVGEKIIFPENDTITLESNYAIVGVVLSYRAAQTGASPVTTLTPTLNIASTDYTGTGLSITTVRKNHQYVFTTNPATSAAWVESDLENIGYGLTANT